MTIILLWLTTTIIRPFILILLLWYMLLLLLSNANDDDDNVIVYCDIDLFCGCIFHFRLWYSSVYDDDAVLCILESVCERTPLLWLSCTIKTLPPTYPLSVTYQLVQIAPIFARPKYLQPNESPHTPVPAPTWRSALVLELGWYPGDGTTFSNSYSVA